MTTVRMVDSFPGVFEGVEVLLCLIPPGAGSIMPVGDLGLCSMVLVSPSAVIISVYSDPIEQERLHAVARSLALSKRGQSQWSEH